MAFQLADITGWQDGLSCTPTALAAISGKAPGEIGELLKLAAKQNGREISASLRNDYDWMATHIGADLELALCDDGGPLGHVFATVGGKVVDTYTNGRVAEFTATPEGYRHFRVKRTFLVWQIAASAEEPCPRQRDDQP